MIRNPLEMVFLPFHTQWGDVLMKLSMSHDCNCCIDYFLELEYQSVFLPGSPFTRIARYHRLLNAMFKANDGWLKCIAEVEATI